MTRNEIIGAIIGATLAIWLFSGCASTQHAAARFVAPSTAPIAQAQVAIAARQVETKTDIAKAQAIVKTLTITLPPDQTEIDSLTQALNDAQSSNDALGLENASLKGANAALALQIGQQTSQANTLADNYDKAQLQITGLEASRHKYVKLSMIFGGILLAEVLAVAGYFALKLGLFSI